jgi:hypothetical protein
MVLAKKIHIQPVKLVSAMITVIAMLFILVPPVAFAQSPQKVARLPLPMIIRILNLSTRHC